MTKKRVEKACLFSCFVLTLLLCLMVSCNFLDNNTDGKIPIRGTHIGLSETTEMKILSDCYKQYSKPFSSSATINNLIVEIYGGTYNGCVVAVIFHNPRGVYITHFYPPYKVAGINFWDFRPKAVAPLVWKDGLFYSLLEAYDSGWLTVENLQNIADRINPEKIKDYI